MTVRVNRDPRGYCAAPWTQGVLRRSGVLQACCRNEAALGDWAADGLEGAWRSAAFQRFRAEVAAGRPDAACRTCLANGGARSLEADLVGPFHRALADLAAALGEVPPAVAALGGLLTRRTWSADVPPVLGRYAEALDAAAAALPPPAVDRAVRPLRAVGQVVEACLRGDPAPPQVAPFRQVELSTRCNARCIHCLFLHTGELAEGATMPAELVERAFAAPGSILDFFMYGAEFLFFPGWREVAARLGRVGVRLSLSSNGMLLTPANVRHLVDHRVAARLNVSLDGARRETVEAVRANVSFERLLSNLDDLVGYADAHQPELELTLSFVLMVRNHAELPDLVDLASRLRRGRRPVVNVSFSGLESYRPASYQDFLAREHHALLPREVLLRLFEETARRARRGGVAVAAFHSWPLERFLAEGAPYPPLPPPP